MSILWNSGIGKRIGNKEETELGTGNREPEVLTKLSTSGLPVRERKCF